MGDVVNFHPPLSSVDDTLDSFKGIGLDTVLIIGIHGSKIEYGWTGDERSKLLGQLEILKYCLLADGDSREG